MGKAFGTFAQNEGKRILSVGHDNRLFDRGWGLVRASNTQPVLVLRFEAYEKESLNEIKDQVTRSLKRFPSVKLAD